MAAPVAATSSSGDHHPDGPIPVGSLIIGRSAHMSTAMTAISTTVSRPNQASLVSHHSPVPMAGCGITPVG
jgi:hypothetical protein